MADPLRPWLLATNAEAPPICGVPGCPFTVVRNAPLCRTHWAWVSPAYRLAPYRMLRGLDPRSINDVMDEVARLLRHPEREASPVVHQLSRMMTEAIGEATRRDMAAAKEREARKLQQKLDRRSKPKTKRRAHG